MPQFIFTLVPYCKQDAFKNIFLFCTGLVIFPLSFRLGLDTNVQNGYLKDNGEGHAFSISVKGGV
jgi:hypothetical protein